MTTNIEENFKVPIVLIMFNRPLETSRVLEKIKEVKPERLFIISDGSRNNEEKEKVQECRNLINKIDWKCKIETNYSDVNMGCRNRISSGLNWVFKKVDKAIILEDDCLPDISFFYYCERMLDLYKNDERVMSIEGTNLSNNIYKIEGSEYFFGSYASLWGWATWKESWEKIDLNLTTLSDKERQLKIIKNIGLFKYLNYRKIFMKVKQGKINSWGYSWIYTILSLNGVVIVPYQNLIENIGFSEGATHTNNFNEFRKIKALKLSESIKYAGKQKIIINNAYNMDYYLYHNPKGTYLKSMIPSSIKKYLKKGKKLYVKTDNC